MFASPAYGGIGGGSRSEPIEGNQLLHDMLAKAQSTTFGCASGRAKLTCQQRGMLTKCRLVTTSICSTQDTPAEAGAQSTGRCSELEHGRRYETWSRERIGLRRDEVVIPPQSLVYSTASLPFCHRRQWWRCRELRGPLWQRLWSEVEGDRRTKSQRMKGILGANQRTLQRAHAIQLRRALLAAGPWFNERCSC